MVYIMCFLSVILNFIFVMMWGFSEGNIDNLIHYLNINYPDAVEGIRRDYVIKIGHYQLGGKHNLDRDERRTYFEEDD